MALYSVRYPTWAGIWSTSNPERWLSHLGHFAVMSGSLRESCGIHHPQLIAECPRLPWCQMTADPITARLAEIALEIEAHEAAAWLLDRERLELRQRLRALNRVSAEPSVRLPRTAGRESAERPGLLEGT